ncbi:RHS repeat-associated core domain-containing protein [Chryseobacterium sp.]|uniref:RHS repeat domain-containing protein n=1 Tax=Chryseobacterium sp. TaxID=1871047 RepID=UPI0025C33D8B|nr:RHS repeat-associated core domain-containing protein [Chryseobacterium sp.]
MGNTRLTFARTTAGVLEFVDKNDYYPFGMNHLKSGNAFFGAGSYKNYKYNGKELQETGMYDYGARFYMPDIGRWGVVDPLAETSILTLTTIQCVSLTLMECKMKIKLRFLIMVI